MELHSGKEFEVVSIRKRVRVRHLSIQCELEARTRVQKLYELVALFFPFPHSAELRKAVWLSCKEIWAGSWVTLGISEFSA